MKRLFYLSLLLLLVPLADWFRQNDVMLDGKRYSRDATVLVLPGGVPEQAEKLALFPNLCWVDLRGVGLSWEEYEKAARWAGGARILWELDFQGRRISPNAEILEIDHLTDEDVAALRYLPRLRLVKAESCRDYPQLLALRDGRPGCQVRYRVELGGKSFDCRASVLVPGPCNEIQLRQALGLLPWVRRVDLRQTGLSPRQARALSRDYAPIRFVWEETWADVTFSTDAREIDLSGVEMESTEAVEELLPYLPRAEKIIMCDCGISSPEMAALGQRHPEIRFVWRVKLGPLSARTDDTWFAPITHRQLIGGQDADELQYCVDMECIDLGHCWISHCEWARNMKNLRYLVLADTRVTDLSPLSGLKNLTYLELFVTPVRDYSPLLGCTGLEDLNLGYTYGDPTPISKMTWLKNLWWCDANGVHDQERREAVTRMCQTLKDTNIAIYIDHPTASGWRKLPNYYAMRDILGMFYMD